MADLNNSRHVILSAATVALSKGDARTLMLKP